MTHKRILMAIDAITACKGSGIHQRAEVIAQHTGAEINTLHIAPNLAAYGMGGALASLTDVEPAMNFETNEIHSPTSERGDLVLLTETRAEEMAADLVVTAEHTAESLWFNRDDDKALLRHAHQDMLFVKKGGHDAYQQILCLVNIDHKNASMLIRKAKQFANEMNAPLNLAYIIGAYPYAGLEHLGLGEVACEEEAFLRTCKETLQQLAEPFDISLERQHVRVGKRTLIIEQEIRILQADLLIMANQQQHGLRKFAPSIPAKTLHHVECDLLAIYLEERTNQNLKRFYYH